MARDYFESVYDYRRQAQADSGQRQYVFSEDEMEIILYALNNTESLADAALTDWEKRWEELSAANGGD